MAMGCKIRHVLSGLALAFVGTLALLACPTTPPAWADEVQLTAETTTWTANNTYVAKGKITINDRVTTEGDGVVLLLKDGCELTINGGILIGSSNDATITETLTIKGKSTDEDVMGKLIVQNVAATDAGIEPLSGKLHIEGGTIKVAGGEGGAGIGSGGEKGCSSISISGGYITAKGGPSSAGIGNGAGGQSYCASVSISGGTVTAEGSEGGAGIGSGSSGYCANVSISGGTVTAKGSDGGAGIGSGRNDNGKCGSVSISGGVVFATGSGDIIGKAGGWCDTVTIDNAVVFKGANGLVYGSAATPTDSFTVPAGHTLTVGSGKTLNIGSGKTMTVAGDGKVNVNSGGKMAIDDGGVLVIKGGGSVTVDQSGNLNNDGVMRVMKSGDLNASKSTGNLTGGNEYCIHLSFDQCDMTDKAVATYGESVVLPSATLEGYALKWQLQDTSTMYDPDTTVAAATGNDIFLIESWQPISYNITYKLDGGTNNPSNPATYTIESDTITLADPSRAGYDFKGWIKDDTTPVTQISKGSTGDITLHARWQARESVISFESNGGSDVAAITGKTDQSVADRTLPTPTRYSHSFMGWYSNADLSGEPVEQLPEAFPADGVTYYAKWQYYCIHTPQVIAAVPATCTEPGLTEGSKCSSCGQMLKAQEEVPALGHEWGEWVVTQPATVFAEGVETSACTHDGCDAVQTRAIPKLDIQTVKSAGVTYSFDGKALTVTSFAKNKARVYVPAKVKVEGKYYKVTGIAKGALKGCKATMLVIKSKALTKKSTKGCLKGSKIKTVVVKVGSVKANKSYAKKYKKLFAKKNCGKKVTLKASKKALK